MQEPKPASPGARSSGRKILPYLVPIFVLLLASPGIPENACSQPRYDFPADTLGGADRTLYFETNLGLIERATVDAVDQALQGLRLPPGSDILLSPLRENDGNWFVEDFIARRLNDAGYSVHVEPPLGSVAAPPTTTTTPSTPSGGPSSLADAMKHASASASADSSVDSTKTAPANPDTVTAATPRRRPNSAINPPPPKGQANAEPEGQMIPVPEGRGLVFTYRLVEFGVTYHDSWRRGFMGSRVVERLASVNLYCRLVSDGPRDVLWVGQGKSERLDIVPKSKLDLLEGLSYPFTPKPTLRQEPLSRFLEPVLVTSIIGGLVYLFYTNQK